MFSLDASRNKFGTDRFLVCVRGVSPGPSDTVTVRFELFAENDFERTIWPTREATDVVKSVRCCISSSCSTCSCMGGGGGPARDSDDRDAADLALLCGRLRPEPLLGDRAC
jgi:hypothetical protein